MQKIVFLMIALLVAMPWPAAAQTTTPPDVPALILVGPLGKGAALDVLVLDDARTLAVLREAGISFYDLSAADLAATERYIPLEQPIQPENRQLEDGLLLLGIALIDESVAGVVDVETGDLLAIAERGQRRDLAFLGAGQVLVGNGVYRLPE